MGFQTREQPFVVHRVRNGRFDSSPETIGNLIGEIIQDLLEQAENAGQPLLDSLSIQTTYDKHDDCLAIFAFVVVRMQSERQLALASKLATVIAEDGYVNE